MKTPGSPYLRIVRFHPKLPVSEQIKELENEYFCSFQYLFVHVVNCP